MLQSEPMYWVRYLGGGPSLVPEIAQNRATQETLPQRHPARIFGSLSDGKAPALMMPSVSGVALRPASTMERLLPSFCGLKMRRKVCRASGVSAPR